MPFYEYECAKCKFYTEVLQKISDPPLRKCPSCGKLALKKLISAPVFRLKGSGWYETDFKSDNENKRNLVGDDKAPSDKVEGKAEGNADAKVEAKTDAKVETKSDAKPEARTESKAAGSGSAKGESGAAGSSARKTGRSAAKPVRKAAAPSRSPPKRAAAKPTRKKARR